MDSINDFNCTSSYFKLNKKITEFDVNNNYIAAGDNKDVIDIILLLHIKNYFLVMLI